MMNYFIMLARAVIKCVLFYDDGVIEAGCNKSCLGLLFLFFFLSPSFELVNAERNK